MRLHIVQFPLLQVFKDLCYMTERDYGIACQGIYNAAISCAYWDTLAKKNCMTNGSRSSPRSEGGLWLVQVKVCSSRAQLDSAPIPSSFRLSNSGKVPRKMPLCLLQATRDYWKVQVCACEQCHGCHLGSREPKAK